MTKKRFFLILLLVLLAGSALAARYLIFLDFSPQSYAGPDSTRLIKADGLELTLPGDYEADGMFSWALVWPDGMYVLDEFSAGVLADRFPDQRDDRRALFEAAYPLERNWFDLALHGFPELPAKIWRDQNRSAEDKTRLVSTIAIDFSTWVVVIRPSGSAFIESASGTQEDLELAAARSEQDLIDKTLDFLKSYHRLDGLEDSRPPESLRTVNALVVPEVERSFLFLPFRLSLKNPAGIAFNADFMISEDGLPLLPSHGIGDRLGFSIGAAFSESPSLGRTGLKRLAVAGVDGHQVSWLTRLFGQTDIDSCGLSWSDGGLRLKVYGQPVERLFYIMDETGGKPSFPPELMAAQWEWIIDRVRFTPLPEKQLNPGMTDKNTKVDGD